ncbi:MAG: hypothetical protein QOE49_3733 [Rhodospirillaceae bacterium]|jgi:hypothetical protein|nr:hypothetical protein [Rhodospirillaceae bacterium]
MPAPNQELRVRAERLLRGDFRVDDLTKLFLYARDRCDGRESVQEIGDFVAHHDERRKGIVTRSVRDLFAFMRFRFPDLAAPLNISRLPSNFPLFLDAAMRLTKNDPMRSHTGISWAKAVKMLPSMKSKLITNTDGTLRFDEIHVDELALIRRLASVFTVRPAFTGERLFDDFHATLQKRSILRPSEAKQFRSIAPMVMLFAAAEMHNSVLLMDDGTQAHLALFVDKEGIQITATFPPIVVARNPGNGLVVVTSIYATKLKGEEYCEPDLLAQLPRQAKGFGIEITPNRRLGILA